MSDILLHRRLEWRAANLSNFVDTLSFWVERQRTRHALAKLADDPHALRDVGITPTQARREAAKWFWMP